MKTTWLGSMFFALTAALTVCFLQPAAVQYSAGDWLTPDDQPAYMTKFLERVPSEARSSKYKINGTCGGWPRVDVKTAPGFCLGLVYDGGGTYKKLRWVAPVSASRAILTEMGGWAPFRGEILLLDFAKGKSTVKSLINSKTFPANDPRRGIIHQPNQVSKGPDGRFYVGAASGIYRFDPSSSNPAQTVETVIAGLPSAGLHPLKSFTFDTEGDLYVNVGSASNVCQNFTKHGDSDPKKNPKNFKKKQFANCPEAEDMAIGQAQIRKYRVKADRTYAKEFVVYAKGLRNSISLVWDAKTGVLLEGDNGRDAINKFAPELKGADFPHEELNIVREGKHYGWPYCYDNNRNNPEWKNIDCSRFEAPSLLLPAHAAPLGFHIYEGAMFPSWYKGRLIAAFHGYEAKGHRLVTFNYDDKGFPMGVPLSLVYGWGKRGDQEKGKPVGIGELPDGSLLIVEDDPQNKVLRLFYDKSAGDGAPVREIDDTGPGRDASEVRDEEARKNRLADKLRDGNAPPFTRFQAKVIDKNCYECHQTDGAPGVQLLRYDDEGNARRIIAAGKAKHLVEILKGSPGYLPMPPQGWDSPAEQAEAVRLLELWVKTLK